ncbi:MAG: sensor histidine kinase [Desulfitobacteriaceae bacterium]
MSFARKIRGLAGKVRWQPGLAWKIALWYMLLLLLTVLMLSGLTYFGNRQALVREKRQFLENSVAQISNILNDRGEGQAMDIRDSELFKGNVPQGVNLQISSLSGDVIQHTGSSLLPVAADVNPEIRVFNGEDFVYVARPIQSQGKIIAYLQGTLDLDDVELAQRVLLKQIFVVGGSALLFAALGGLILARQVLSPLAKLNAAISGLTARDLSQRLPLKGNGDELDRLGQNFNRMLERLEISFAQQKQFVANASHELRTPLMVIGGHADILERWGAADPGVVKDSAHAIANEVGMMTKLVENLLTLAREELVLSLSVVNLSELVMEGTSGLPFMRTHQVQYDVASEVYVHGDALYLKQVLRIIMENASKYVPPGGHIVIRLQNEDERALITIEDDGPGIPPESLETVFDRFYRVDQARSRSVPGYGLGLSIAKKIVEQHQGRMWAENVDPHGACFWVELPL